MATSLFSKLELNDPIVKPDGRVTALTRRSSEDPQVVAYMKEGDQMGYLWYQGCFEEADPR